MNLKVPALGAVILLTSLAANAQLPKFTTGDKLDGPLKTFLAGSVPAPADERRAAAQAEPSELQTGVIISTTDAVAVQQFLQANGAEATCVTDNVVTTRIGADLLRSLSGRDDVLLLRQPRKFRPLLDKARATTNATAVQAGTDLETPFDGTGVLIGVIDQSFYPKHLAFYDADGNTRVKQYWNRSKYPRTTTRPTTILPEQGDGLQASSHATHVSGIAAGRDVGNGYQGMAPGADLYFIPSSFDEAEILEDVRTIAAYAAQQGQPFVVNMSFGSQTGPHDGSTQYDKTMDRILNETGGFICAAMGNEGTDRIHLYNHFKPLQTKRFLVTAGDEQTLGTIWEQDTDGRERVSFKPFYLVGTTRTYLTSSDLNNTVYWYEGIDNFNGKHYAYFQFQTSSFQAKYGANASFGVELVASSEADVHAWLEANCGYFASKVNYLSGDSKYLVGEGAASVPHAFGIGAYTSRTTFYSTAYRAEVGIGSETTGKIASFSSPGPSLNEEYPKPTVAAPGCILISAMNQYDSDFSELEQYGYVSGSVKSGTKTYYYGAMQGTSMASPAAAGIVALWLQANPALTYEQIMGIFAETSIHDRYAVNDYDDYYGYGKIDAYAGLKRALELAAQTGISETRNTAQPLTIKSGNGEWRLLFNNDEDFARITVSNAAGQTVVVRLLDGVRQGEEQVLSSAGLPAGVYLVSVATTRAQVTRKFVVR